MDQVGKANENSNFSGLALKTITESIDEDGAVPYWVLIIYGFIACAFAILLGLQLWKMPTDDFFVKKASIYLVVGASIRSISCYWIVMEGRAQ